MLIIRNIKETIKLYNICQSVLIIRNLSTKNLRPVDLSYNTYENVKTRNDLPPLIVMHGLFGSKQNWRAVCKQLIKKLQNRKIIAVDARNHGESPHTPEHRYDEMAEDVIQLIRKENLEKACLMGHSMGGRCMMYTALRYPHLIEKVIIVDISPLSSSLSLEHMNFIIYALSNVNVTGKLDMAVARKEADNQLQNLNVQNPYFRQFILTNFIRDTNGDYRWRFNIEAIDKSFAEHILHFPQDAVHFKYPGPILFIGGAETDSISENHMPKIKNLYFPAAQLVMLQNAGHLIHVDQPDLLIDLTVKFLQ